MLNQLFLTASILLGVGGTTPTPLNNKTNARNNDEATNFSLNVTTVSQASNTTGSIYSRKYNYQSYNDALMVKGNCYTQNVADDYNYQTFNEMANHDGMNNMSYILQITPYKYLYGASATIYLDVNVDWYTPNVQTNPITNDTLRLNMYILTSRDNWSNYIDMANYYRQGHSSIIYNEITNTNNGYNYTEYYNYKDIEIVADEDEASYNQLTWSNIPVNIVNGSLNYCYIYITPEWIPNIEQEPGGTTFDITELLLPHGRTNGTTLFTIQGQQIPPVTNYEVVDIPGLMFYILTMPFTFISTGFNLTLFPGTIYQFNIGNIFLTIIGILSFLFLIRILTRNR